MQDKYILFADGKSPHTLKWIKELIKYYELYVISLRGYDENILHYIPKDRVIVLNESVKTQGGNIKLLFKYFDLIKSINDINPKYLNAHFLSSYGVLAAFIKLKIPALKLIQSTWGTDVLVTPFESKIKFWAARFALSKADLITSDSYFMSDKIKEIYPDSYIDTFPFGLNEFDIEEIDKDEDLIFSNRLLSKNYNIDKVIKWFATLEQKYNLVIANNGDMKEELISLVDKLNIADRVKFVGFLNDKEQEYYYKKAKYYISIPTSDSTSVSLLEAMRYGCYPIVSNLAANREWIINNFNGSFFNHNLILSNYNKSIGLINQKIIYKNAIFSKSIENYVNRLKRV